MVSSLNPKTFFKTAPLLNRPITKSPITTMAIRIKMTDVRHLTVSVFGIEHGLAGQEAA